MKIKSLISVLIASQWAIFCIAQSNQTDTLITKGTSTHMYLNIAIPKGEVRILSSDVCGKSYARIVSPDASLQPQLVEDKQGNISYTITFRDEGPAAAPRQAPPANARMADMRPKAVVPAHLQHFQQQLVNFDAFYGKAGDYSTEFRADPSLSTELFVNVGSGGSALDLSGLNLYKVTVNSAFSDIKIAYSKPNLCVMQKMDVHAVRANIEMRNIELARAELISVQNDMGETHLILGNNELPGSTIYLSSGSGNCYISIHKDHPTKVVIRKGFFARVNVRGNFEIMDKNAFGNLALTRHEGKYTTIICNMDFGKIYIQETRN